MAATADEVVRLRGALALETALRARAAWRVRSIMMGGGVERNRGGREETKWKKKEVKKGSLGVMFRQCL